jgi:hypothetical protein
VHLQPQVVVLRLLVPFMQLSLFLLPLFSLPFFPLALLHLLILLRLPPLLIPLLIVVRTADFDLRRPKRSGQGYGNGEFCDNR